MKIPLLALLVAGVIAACGTPPPVHLHTLMSPEPETKVAAAAPVPIGLDAVRLPVQVDQPQLVVRSGEGAIAALDNERWVSPLADEFRLALLESLIARHGAYVPVAGSATPAVRIAVELRRFDSWPGRESRIAGSWSLQARPTAAPTPSASFSLRCDFYVKEPAGAGYADAVAAHRRIVARLADAIGAALAPASRGIATSCPAGDPA